MMILALSSDCGSTPIHQDELSIGALQRKMWRVQVHLCQCGGISLNCVDIEGLDWIRLKEYQLFYPGSPWDITTKKSTDIFALLDTRGRVIPAGGRLVKASFDVKFADSRTTRSVVVRPPNVAMYTRDEDSVLVERWLESRGFILSETSEFNEPVAATLASA